MIEGILLFIYSASTTFNLLTLSKMKKTTKEQIFQNLQKLGYTIDKFHKEEVYRMITEYCEYDYIIDNFMLKFFSCFPVVNSICMPFFIFSGQLEKDYAEMSKKALEIEFLEELDRKSIINIKRESPKELPKSPKESLKQEKEASKDNYYHREIINEEQEDIFNTPTPDEEKVSVFIKK